MTKHFPQILLFPLVLALALQGCESDLKNESLAVSIADDRLNSFVALDTLENITQNLFDYFESTNDADWNQLMHHFPLHKNSDTAFINSSIRALDYWTERGVQNRTEMA